MSRVLNPYISVDCVIFGYDEGELFVLLVEREMKDETNGKVRFADLTLTGNHIYQDEELDDAAARVLFDLTGLKEVYLEQFGVFGGLDRFKAEKDKVWLKHLGRDPESRILSIGYFALLAARKVSLEWKGRDVRWTPLADVGTLGFDHNRILSDALEALRNKMRHEPVAFELLPPKFTLTELQNLYEVIYDTVFDKRNFRKKVSRMKFVLPLDEKQSGVPHKPARLYKFSRKEYEKTRGELLYFNV